MTCGDDRDRRKLRRDLAAIAVLTAVLAVPSLFTRDLWNPDEARYMEVAREMFVMHDYVIPRLNAEPYTDKPPLFFYLAGLLWRAGLGVMSGRILAALVSMGTLLATYFFSRRFLKGDGPILAALVTLSLLLFTGHAKVGVIDPLHALLVGGAVLAGYLALHRAGGRPTLWWLAAYGLAGLDVLTKGPVGIALPAVVLAAYAVLERRRVRAGGWAHAAGAALLLAVALAWLIPAMAIGGAAYSRDLLGQKSLGYVVNSWRHAEPFYYFIQWAPVLVLPWSLLLPLPIYAAVRDRREDDARPPFFTVVWCAATVAFFSCISGKRFGYMLPIAPAVGMLVGWYLSGGLAQRHPRCQAAGPWLMRATLGAFGAVLAGLMALTFLPARWAALTGADSGAFGARWQAQSLVLLLLPLGCCIAGCVWAGKRLRRAAVLLVLAVALGSLWFDLSLASPMNATKSSRAFCEEMKPYLATTSKLRFYSADFSGAVNLYTGRVSIPAIWGGRQLREALRDPETLVLSDLKRFGDVLSEAELERYTVFRGTVGGRRMLLLRGRAPSAAQPAPAGP